MRKMILAVAVLLLLSSIPMVVSQPHPGDADGTDFGVGPRGSNPLRVLLAFDEEVVNSNYDWFGDSVYGPTYVEYQTLRALYRFPWTIVIGGYVQWDSDDSYNLEETLLEVEEEVGWNRGMVYNGKWMSLLMAWTGQEYPYIAGKAYIGHAVCISTIQINWFDDNTAQEEITHLFGVDSHVKMTVVLCRLNKPSTDG